MSPELYNDLVTAANSLEEEARKAIFKRHDKHAAMLLAKAAEIRRSLDEIRDSESYDKTLAKLSKKKDSCK
jgi:hypothetical protein